MKLPLKAVLVTVDKVLAVAQLIDAAATAIGGLFKKKKKPKLSDMVERRVDRGARTVVLRRPPTSPKD